MAQPQTRRCQVLVVRADHQHDAVRSAAGSGIGQVQQVEGLGSMLRTPNLKLGHVLANRSFPTADAGRAAGLSRIPAAMTGPAGGEPVTAGRMGDSDDR